MKKVFDAKRTDKECRQKQSVKVVRILRVHRLTWREEILAVPQAEAIARELGVTTRTVYRDLATLKMVYAALGTRSLDGWKDQ